jgi:protein TonB
VDLFRLAMRAAVQSVADQVYPNGVQQGGAPVVSFDYKNGVISNIALVTSSGFARLDAAAMQAVRIAPYPPEPDEFHGQAESVTVTVIFRAAVPSVDGD